MRATRTKNLRPQTARPAKKRRPVASSEPALSRRQTKVISDTPRLPAKNAGPNLRLTIQMVLMARRWRAILDDRLRPLGQSSARMETLSAIYRSPRTSQQVELAKRLGVEGATITRMLDSLEGEGLVERRADPSDRRAKHIKLTKRGEAELAKITNVAEVLRSHLLEGIAPGDIDKANEFLAHLLDRLSGEFPPTDAPDELAAG